MQVRDSRSESFGQVHPAGPWIAAIVPVACLLPFLDKAVHIDDALFVWVAKQIAQHPADFFGFDVNWYGSVMPMYDVLKNPPGVAYLLAPIGAFSGWSEIAMHSVLLLPAAAFGLGTYALARRFDAQPLVAALAAVLSPAFIVSSSNLMCDTTMAAMYVWAIALWVRGLDEARHAWLIFAAVLIAASSLTKYFAVSLIPLLFVYSLARKQSVGRWAWHFFIPGVALGAYQWYSSYRYGTNLVASAAEYATAHAFPGQTFSPSAVFLITLSFAGGCVISVLCFAPVLWRGRVFLWGMALTALCVCVPIFWPGFIPSGLQGAMKLSPLSNVLCGVFIAGGIQLVALAVWDCARRRDAASLLLFLWIVGTLIFTGFVNWTVNGRSILPLAPAAGILIGRIVRDRQAVGEVNRPLLAYAPLIPAAVISMWVGWGDFESANASRRAASDFAARESEPTGTVYFEGHWGFQYYMELAGAKAIDYEATVLYDDDLVVIPSNNTNIQYLDEAIATPIYTLEVELHARVATTDITRGAGFYSHGYGPLPFVVGQGLPEKFTYYRIGPRTAPA